MMKFLHISLLFILLTTSCGRPLFNLSEGESFTEGDFENPYFSSHDIDYVYKARIEVFSSTLGGLLIIKKIEKNHHRVVFTTEFGTKLLDFEFKGATFKVNFIQQKMNKKMLIHLLRKDFELLISQFNPIHKMYLLEGNNVFLSKKEGKYRYYFTDKNERLTKISSGRKRREQVIILFDKNSDNLAEEIQIKHKNFKLNIELSFLH
ncbi:MAG: hypothetical protein JKY08_04670 [Flavobacteriaceae bacterium]|nr:hypothetical protein [Flavobacteriaceae bacterium]